MAQETGGIKMSGTLVKLASDAPVDTAALADGARFTADGVEVSVAPLAGADWTETESNFRRSEAEMKFHLDRGLTVGYRGFMDCRAEG